MKFSKNLHWLICILFISSCAKQSSPTGGPKDTIPPVLVKAFPSNEAINFKGRSIELTFSEMIILNNPKEQIIITPSIGKDVEFKTKKNSVTLQLDSDLKDSTTYTFNFREAIQDVTEKNPVKNFQLAFSTGSYIDSLSITGTVFDLLKGKEVEDATVAIYPKNDTFNIFKHPATIFTKSDKKGKFRIDHLKPDIYFIYAIDDNNRNLVADSKSEAYGFLRDSINLTKDTTNMSVPLIHLDTRPLKLSSARPYNTYFNLRTTKNLKNYTISSSDGTQLKTAYGEDHSNLRVYNTTEGDSIEIRLIAHDSIGNTLDSTLYAKFLTREVTPEKFDMNIKSSSIIASKGLLNAIITFTKPLKHINFDSVRFEIDSLTTINFSQADTIWNYRENTLTINKKSDKTLFTTKTAEQEAEEKYQKKSKKDTASVTLLKKINELQLGKGAFVSIENDSSKRAKEKIRPQQIEDLSMIMFDVKAYQIKVVVQLLDKNFTVVKEISNATKAEFHDLPAGEYMLRVITDRNGNGKWDPGNYYKKEDPEPITYYKDDKGTPLIKLKANWEIQLAPMLIKY